MDARERFTNSLTFQPVDRPFRWESLGMWPETLARWYGEGLDLGLQQAQAQDWGAMLDDEYERVLVRGFGFDRLDYLRGAVVSGYTESPYFPAFERTVLAETESTRIVRGSDGIVQKEFKTFETSSMPQFLKFPVENRQDFVNLLPRLDPDSPGRFGGNWPELCRAYAGRDFPLGLTLCGAFGHPRNLFGIENLCAAYYDQPSLVHEILEHWANFYCRLSRRVWQDVHFDFILIWEDMAYKGGSLISPRLVREFMLPYYRRVIETVRGLGCELIIVDTDGDVRQLAPLFIETGVNVLLPFEVQAGMDVRQFRALYGKSLALIGGLDKRLLVHAGPRLEEEIEQKAFPLLEEGGYIASLDHTVPPDVSLENFRRYLELLRRLSGKWG